MNERFLELAHQAKIEFTYDPTETPMRAFAECWEDELQKFAELIVRECADRIRFCIKNDIDFIAEDIEKHFGVE